MMSFFPTTTSISTKPHIRQEGFVPDDLFTSNHAKYPPPPLNLPSMDFGDELAGLMAADTNANRSLNGYHHHQHQQHVHQDNFYRHNIFDTSVPSHPPVVADSNTSASSSTTGSIGPTRTTRSRRNGSISGTSPPPLHHGHQHHAHHHSLSHSGALNGGLNSIGFAMGMNSLDGSMGMMGMGALGPLQSPTLQTSSLSTNNNNSTLSSSLPSPTGPLPSSVGSSSPAHSASTITANHQDKQSILANEKRRRRRESHNAVERRRRDNINEKISELATLIPDCMLEGGGSNGVHGSGGSSPSHLTPTSPGTGGIELLDSSSYDLTNAHGNRSSSPISGIKEENRGQDEAGGVIKANKGMILRKSVDYIRYLQQLVTAQGARNRELEQQLRAYRESSNGGDSTPSHSGGSQDDVDDILMFQDGVDVIGGNTGVVEYGSYAAERRGRLPSMPEDDDEVDDHHHQYHQHQQHHQPQQHQHHHQQQHHHRENIVEVDMGMNMGMMGMHTTMNGGGGGHFNGMDNNRNHAAAPDHHLRGRTRVVGRPNDVGADETIQHLGIGGGLKEDDDDDDDDIHVVGGFGIGVGRTTRAI